MAAAPQTEDTDSRDLHIANSALTLMPAVSAAATGTHMAIAAYPEISTFMMERDHSSSPDNSVLIPVSMGVFMMGALMGSLLSVAPCFALKPFIDSAASALESLRMNNPAYSRAVKASFILGLLAAAGTAYLAISEELKYPMSSPWQIIGLLGLSAVLAPCGFTVGFSATAHAAARLYRNARLPGGGYRPLAEGTHDAEAGVELPSRSHGSN